MPAMDSERMLAVMRSTCCTYLARGQRAGAQGQGRE